MEVTDHVSEVRTKVRSLTDLPPVPLVAQRLLTLLADENVEIEDAARTIEMDPGLSARIIGLAGSAYFGSAQPILTVKEAIIRVLGLNMVKSLAISIAISAVFKAERCKAFDISCYWSSAMLGAHMAQRLAGAVSASVGDASRRPDPGMAYLGGLLHNLGLMVLAHLYPAEMGRVLSAANPDTEGDLVAKEREYLGVDHHETGSWLAHRWHLPGEVIVVIGHHHERDYRGEAWPISLLTGICARWVRSQLAHGDGVPVESGSLQALGIPESRLERAWASCERQREEMTEMAKAFADAA